MEKTIDQNVEKNIQKLQENLKYKGFDKIFDQPLREKIESGVSEFTLQHGTDTITYDLHFKKSTDQDKWYFNKMDAALLPTEKHPEGRAQTFYENQNITAKEAINLLQGRSVYKTMNVYEKVGGEGEKAQYKWTPETYKTWLTLDFEKPKDKNNNYEVQTHHEKWGFDLEKKVREIGLVEAANDLKLERIVMSLQKGNLVEATQDKDGKQKQVFLMADPEHKTLIMLDSNKKRMFQEHKQSEGKSQGGNEPAAKASAAQEKNEAVNRKPRKGKGMRH